MLVIIASLVLIVAMLLTLVRAGIGPTWHDRALAGNVFTTIVILLISVYLFESGHPEFLDIALLYALISYAGTLALVRYLARPGVEDLD